jgi:hypothetical protein
VLQLPLDRGSRERTARLGPFDSWRDLRGVPRAGRSARGRHEGREVRR